MLFKHSLPAVFLSALVLSGCADSNEPADSVEQPSPYRLISKSCWFKRDSSWPKTQCYMMEVPEDYARPQGRKVRFPVVRFQAFEPAADKAPLLHLGAGGPGASLGLEPENATEWLWVNYADMTVDDGRDLIVMDPRGTGMAEPRLSCTEFIRDADTAFRRPLATDEEGRVFTFSMERCYERLSDQADLAQYHSANIARDVEALREQLGVVKLDLYGVSYSTRYALTLARDFPDAVRSLVLNSAVFPDIKYTQKLAADSIAAYARGFDFCKQQPECNQAYPNLEQRLVTLVETLDETPLTVNINHLYSKKEYPFVLTGQRLLRVLFQALYNENFYPKLPLLIEELEKGESATARAPIAKFMNIILDPYFGDAAGVSHFCYEEAPFVDFDQAREEAADAGPLATAARTDLDLMQVQCRIWAIPSAPMIEGQPINTPLPALVMHGGLDPVLAAEDVDKARKSLPNHQWLLFPHLSHDVISASDCAEGAAAHFLDAPEEQVAEPAMQCRQRELEQQQQARDDAGEAESAPPATGTAAEEPRLSSD